MFEYRVGSRTRVRYREVHWKWNYNIVKCWFSIKQCWGRSQLTTILLQEHFLDNHQDKILSLRWDSHSPIFSRPKYFFFSNALNLFPPRSSSIEIIGSVKNKARWSQQLESFMRANDTKLNRVKTKFSFLRLDQYVEIQVSLLGKLKSPLTSENWNLGKRGWA